MNCEETREHLFHIAEESTQGRSGTAEKNSLPKPVLQHLQECRSCAVLAEALQLVEGESPWSREVPSGLTARIQSSLREETAGGTDESIRSERKRAGLREVLFGRTTKQGSMGWAGLAAAALILVAFSISLTLYFERNSMQFGPNTAQEPGSNGGVSGELVQGPQRESSAEEEVVRVILSLEAPTAESVAVVGDWNGWDSKSHQMNDADRDGVWELSLRLERGKEYQYQFLIDQEKWVPDPHAPLQVDDGFGGTNSILDI